ncbi:MAG: thioredoxin [Gemmatimonadaceae bacterium]|nr:thioredoxin [Gemmatimonadaceae bacterium]
MSTAQDPTIDPAASAGSLTLQCQFCLTWNRVAAERVADRPKCGKCAKPMLLDRPFPLTEDAFTRTVAESTLPVLVDFYADWCGPCKMMAPFMDEIAREYQGRALIAKLDSDRAPRTSLQHQVRGLPTTVVFKAGKEVARQVGAVGKPQLTDLLRKAL